MRISDWSSDVCSSDLFRRKFEVRPLDDGIDRARFLTEAAIDALGHVDVVARRAAAAVLARLGLDCDGERRAHRLAQFARDTALLAIRITAQRMLAAETGRDRVLLVRVVDRRLGRSEEHTSELQSLMRISYAVFCLKKKTYQQNTHTYISIT